MCDSGQWCALYFEGVDRVSPCTEYSCFVRGDDEADRVACFGEFIESSLELAFVSRLKGYVIGIDGLENTRRLHAGDDVNEDVEEGRR